MAVTEAQPCRTIESPSKFVLVTLVFHLLLQLHWFRYYCQKESNFHRKMIFWHFENNTKDVSLFRLKTSKHYILNYVHAKTQTSGTYFTVFKNWN
jgi:hypothetical protein